MINKTIYNKNFIEYIEIFPERIADDIFYQEEKKNFFGVIKQEEGYFLKKRYPVSPKKLDKIPNGYVIKNNNDIYEKPCLVIHYINIIQKIHFNTEKELEVYVKRNFQDDYWINGGF